MRRRSRCSRAVGRIGGPRRYDGNALQTLVAIMNDDRATTAARVRCAEFILDRAHGKPAYLEDPNRDPDFVPLAERLKAYVRRDQILAPRGRSCNYRPRPTGLLRDVLCPSRRARLLAPCHERPRLKTTRSVQASFEPKRCNPLDGAQRVTQTIFGPTTSAIQK